LRVAVSCNKENTATQRHACALHVLAQNRVTHVARVHLRQGSSRRPPWKRSDLVGCWSPKGGAQGQHERRREHVAACVFSDRQSFGNSDTGRHRSGPRPGGQTHTALHTTPRPIVPLCVSPSPYRTSLLLSCCYPNLHQVSCMPQAPITHSHMTRGVEAETSA
jgi:hypothetical protein